MEMIAGGGIPVVNGKRYPLWSQMVNRKSEWIGGILADHGDNMDNMANASHFPIFTTITGIDLVPNGNDSAMFIITGVDFDCGFDVAFGGMSGNQEHGWVEFAGYGGHRFRIQKRKS